MSCYFIISVFLEPGKDRADYDDYIKLVKPIVEEHGGKYVVRSEGIEYITNFCPWGKTGIRTASL